MANCKYEELRQKVINAEISYEKLGRCGFEAPNESVEELEKTMDEIKREIREKMAELDRREEAIKKEIVRMEEFGKILGVKF